MRTLKVAENFYFYLLKISQLQLSLITLLWLVSAIYVFAGILAALFGFFLGKKVWKNITQNQIFALSQEKNLFTINDFHFSPIILLLHPLFLAFGLLLLENFAFWYAIPLVLFYLILSLVRYGKTLRRLAKPTFWIQLLIVLIFTTLFWNGFTKDNWFDWNGLQTGTRIILRAMLLIVGFSSISVEIKNPIIKTLLFRKGFSGLYLTAELAVSALPFLLKQIVSKKFFLHPIRHFMAAIGFSDILLNAFKQKILQNRQVYIITGETRSGKTTFLKEILEELKKRNKKIQGIIAHGTDHNRERQQFDIEDIATGEKQLLCDRTPLPDDKHLGRFYFKPDGLEFGKKALTVNPKNLPDFLIIDEIGPLELKGEGWYSVIGEIVETYDIPMIWVVRKKILEKVLHTWPHLNHHIFDISKVTVTDVLKSL